MTTSPKFFRKDHIIRTPDGDRDFNTVNKAKRESRKLQLAEQGALGRGCLTVVDKLPPLEKTKAA